MRRRRNRKGLMMDYGIPSGGMVRRQLRALEADVRDLREYIEDEDELPHWLTPKINRASSDIADARRIMRGELESRGIRTNPDYPSMRREVLERMAALHYPEEGVSSPPPGGEKMFSWAAREELNRRDYGIENVTETQKRARRMGGGYRGNPYRRNMRGWERSPELMGGTSRRIEFCPDELKAKLHKRGRLLAYLTGVFEAQVGRKQRYRTTHPTGSVMRSVGRHSYPEKVKQDYCEGLDMLQAFDRRLARYLNRKEEEGLNVRAALKACGDAQKSGYEEKCFELEDEFPVLSAYKLLEMYDRGKIWRRFPLHDHVYYQCGLAGFD